MNWKFIGESKTMRFFFFYFPKQLRVKCLLHASYWNVQVHFTMLWYRLKNYTRNTYHCATDLAGHCETFHPLNDTLIKEVPLQLLNHLSSECQCFYNLRLVKKKICFSPIFYSTKQNYNLFTMSHNIRNLMHNILQLFRVHPFHGIQWNMLY